MDYEIRADKPVFVLSHVGMKPQVVMKRLIERLEVAWRHNFEPFIQEQENKPVEEWEKRNIERIERNRNLYD